MRLRSLKIASLLLFVCFVSFGQTSVPNTETFSLQDVYNAVHAHTSGTQTNLQSCFDNAISGYYNDTYNQDSYAPANSMLRFRDYKPNGCSAPTVTTSSISNIQPFSAYGGGNVTSDGGCYVTARGVCWNTSGTPTISDSKTTDGSGTGSFTSSITGLSCGSTYYVRAYATNSNGTSYGSEVSFTTSLVNVTIVNFITGYQSTLCGNVSISDQTTAQTTCTNIQEGIGGPNCNITNINGQNLRCNNVAIGEIIWAFNSSACQRRSSAWFVWGNGSGTYYIIHTDSNGVIDTKTQCYP